MRITTKKRRNRRRWMKLRDRDLLARYIKDRGYSQARLARHAQCSRQFIYMLLTGEKSTCSKEIGALIEEALNVLPGTLFDPRESPGARRADQRGTTRKRPVAA
jgi:transcriptional regulator with XRE-family HTH domain